MTYPRIEPVNDIPNRPRWSVMVPTYEPSPKHLSEALASVLAQLGEEDTRQIEIVDDCSSGFDPHEFVSSSALETVTVHRNTQRLGLAGNWNSCIQRARGRWVHLLHQDDFVLPGFYDAIRAGTERTPHATPHVAAAFTGSFVIDGDTLLPFEPSIRQRAAGVLTDWEEHVFVRLAIQTPAMVVRRDIYEALGGFDEDFEYALDWDMWKRIAARHPLWCDPRPLACYRAHPRSETARLRRTGQNMIEILRSIERSETLLPPAVAPRVTRRARRAYTTFALENAVSLLASEHSLSGALVQLRAALRIGSPSGMVFAGLKLAARACIRPVRRALRHVAR